MDYTIEQGIELLILFNVSKESRLNAHSQINNSKITLENLSSSVKVLIQFANASLVSCPGSSLLINRGITNNFT